MPDARRISEIQLELSSACNLPAYNAFEQLYVCLLKLAAEKPERDEFDRILTLVAGLSESSASEIVTQPAVIEILHLEPSLESMFSSRHEKLNSAQIAHDLKRLQADSEVPPREKVRSLCYILKSIRNKRTHGFKSSAGPRDNAILRPATKILQTLLQFLLPLATTSESPGDE